ncbi:MAG: Lpg1974 family pore-forming outer membrane protein [Chlamydiales bacterium]
MRKIAILFGVLLLSLSDLAADECRYEVVDRCGCGYIGIEYLYWNLSQVNMPYAVSLENIAQFSNFTEIRQHDHWASGFRLFLGAKLFCGIEGRAAWTRFHNEFKDSFSRSLMIASELLAPNLGLILGGDGIGGPASSKWKIEFDIVDIDLGTRVCLTNAFSLFPYAGVKGGIIDQMQFISYDNFVDTDSANRVNAWVKEKNNIWVVGPKLGFGSEFLLLSCWRFFSDLGVAILYGNQRSPSSINIDDVTPYFSKFHTSKWRAIPCFHIRVGIDWNTQVRECYRLCVGVGYETQYYWDLWRTQNSIIQQVYITDASYGALAMQGLTVKAAFGF